VTILNNYHIYEKRLKKDEYISFLKNTDLGKQYPKERFNERIQRLVNSCQISLVATSPSEEIIGVCFGITDFSYWLFITDLGVDRRYTKQGIGSQLLKKAHEIAGGEHDIAMYLCVNEDAIEFYEKYGFKQTTDIMSYNRIDWTSFKVK
jgi:GNAT superfamily N-acetyltransferase